MKETKEAQQGVLENVSLIVERLDQLMNELRRLNHHQQLPKAKVIRINRQTRVMLEEIRAGLQSDKPSW